MNAQVKVGEVIIGKRVTFGAAISSIAAIFSHIYPEHAAAIVSAAVPVTFIGQLLIARYMGVTQ